MGMIKWEESGPGIQSHTHRHTHTQDWTLPCIPGSAVDQL